LQNHPIIYTHPVYIYIYIYIYIVYIDMCTLGAEYRSVY